MGRPRARGSLAAPLALLCSLAIASARAATGLACPAPGADVRPPFGEIDGPPSVRWSRDPGGPPPDCHLRVETPPALMIAFAARFTHAGPIEELAARLGAVSSTRGLPYWSVTGGRWRELVSSATALGSADADDARPDFDAAEILSGRTLHFAQNDTRSWGLNVYRVRALESSAAHLVLESANVSPVKLGPITLFAPEALRSVQFIERADGDVWSYYGLSLVEDGAPEGSERSLVNRQAAFYRHLIGQEPERDPPLAP